MLNVWINDSSTTGGHAFRGIGIYTRNLLDALKKNKNTKLVDKQEADIYHYPYFDFFFDTLIPDKKKPTVVTVHDVIPLIYPQHYPAGLKGTIRFFKQKRALKRVQAIITDSETSKKDIIRFLDISQEKIHVVHLAPGKQFKKLETTKRYGLPERFILYVGDVNYNKNVEGLIRAFSLLKTKDVFLVLVGRGFQGDSIEAKRTLQLIEELNLKDKIVMPGFVKDGDLVKVYNLATLYCQPSFYEGFGLPVLEAMACGVPVVASRTQVLVEVAEDAAYFVDPKKPEEIAKGLEKVLTDDKLKRALVKSGLLHVQQFSWSKVGDETLNVYKKVAG